MLKYFEHFNYCSVLLKYPITKDDYNLLVELFQRPYCHFKIDFGFIYTIEAPMVELFYKEILQNKKNVEIITCRYKLSRYLHKLGFHTTFKQLLHTSALNLSKVEIVLIGGSADSTKKIRDIVSNISLQNLTLVIVQHIEKEMNSEFDIILQKYTKHKVCYAQDGEVLQKGVIYIAPKDRHLKINNGKFELSLDVKYNYARPSISISYESFSNFYKDKLVVIQECGYAQDGVDKLRLLKENRTTVILQDKLECKAKTMIEKACDNGFYNYILNLNDIMLYLELLDLKLDKFNFISYLLEMIFQKYGQDFRYYQKSTLARRLSIFMMKYNLEDLKDVLEVILFNKRMFKEFFLEVSINVTELFRNPNFFSKIPIFLEENFKKMNNIKIWSAGCSSGEEVYSIAIVLKKVNMLHKSIIYATDFNRVALQEARNAFYSLKSYELAKKNYLEVDKYDTLDNYIEKNDKFIKIKQEIKDKVLFFKHNLALDSSFNEFDVIICKNVLIYFDLNLQKRVFKLFYDSLKFGGFLIIGESEQINESFKDKFEEISIKYKVYKKVA